MGICSAGIADWMVQQKETEVRYYDYALMGGWVYEDDVAKRALKASPITHAAELKGPLLILHGENDIDVPFSQIGKFVEALQNRPTNQKASVALKTYAGEGHGMSGTAAQKGVLQTMEEFLRIHLKPWDFTDNPHGELTAY
jgi:dipeptidyl aminopeptidase/acylaminoacyl peptidase